MQNYNIYRNGEFIGTSEECTYTDEDVSIGNDYVYNISAVYDRGESLWSNEATAQITAGLGNIKNANASVCTTKGGIIVNEDNAFVKVVSSSGALIYAGTVSNGKKMIAVPSGLYIVQVNGVACKVCVK